MTTTSQWYRLQQIFKYVFDFAIKTDAYSFTRAFTLSDCVLQELIARSSGVSSQPLPARCAIHTRFLALLDSVKKEARILKHHVQIGQKSILTLNPALNFFEDFVRRAEIAGENR